MSKIWAIYHPLIIDAMFLAASFESQLKLRTAFHEWHHRVNNNPEFQVYHVAVRCITCKCASTVSAPRSMTTGVTLSADSLASLACHIRIIDVVGYCPCSALSTCPCSLTFNGAVGEGRLFDRNNQPALDLLRFRDGPPVTGLLLSNLPPTKVLAVDKWGCRLLHVTRTYAIVNPPALVLNVSVKDGKIRGLPSTREVRSIRTVGSYPTRFDWAPPSFILVFHPPCALESDELYVEFFIDLAYFIGRYAAFLSDFNLGQVPSFTFVGLDAWFPMQGPMQREPKPELNYFGLKLNVVPFPDVDALWRGVAERIDPRKHWMPRLLERKSRFFTFDEYREDVGVRQFNLYTRVRMGNVNDGALG